MASPAPSAHDAVELVWMPYHWFRFNADGGDGEPLSCLVEGYSGEVLLLSFTDSDFTDAFADFELQPALDGAEAESHARASLNVLQNYSRGKNCRTLRDVASADVLYYPYYVRYFERRRGRFDIRVIDAVTGKPPGAKLKKSLLDAFVAAARAQA